MDDEKRSIILRQVIDILLELWTHRFDKRGALFKRAGGEEGKDAWCIESTTVIEDPQCHRPSTWSFNHIVLQCC